MFKKIQHQKLLTTKKVNWSVTAEKCTFIMTAEMNSARFYYDQQSSPTSNESMQYSAW